MDALLAILGKVGIDSSFFYQLSVFAIFYFIMSFVFIDKLKNVLVARENATGRLENTLEHQEKELEELKKEYEAKKNAAQKKIFAEVESEKKETQELLYRELKSLEKELEVTEGEKIKLAAKEVAEVEKSLSSELSSLKQNLIQKIS
jgi:F0F1-type ATP synthase membrane subunit b/b'